MSTDRFSDKAGWCNTSKLPRGPNGRALCRQCGEEVPKGRRSFCGEPCIHKWKCTTDVGYQRAQLLKRDKGICVLCRLDCERLEASLSRSGKYWEPKRRDRFRALWHWVTGRPPTKKFSGWRTLWEMDHTNPVAEGGGACGLDNLRTLCVWCHNQVTAELCKRLAHEKKRRNAKRLGFNMPQLDQSTQPVSNSSSDETE